MKKENKMKITRFCDEIEFDEYRISDLQNSLMQKFITELNDKADSFLVEGLKRKGFEFSKSEDLIKFIKTHCSAIDNQEHQEKVYSVKGKPFLLHKYGLNTEINYDNVKNRSTIISASLGEMYFL